MIRRLLAIRGLSVAALLAAASLAGLARAEAPLGAVVAAEGEQVEAGRTLFTANCKMCHGEEGTGGRAPALRGPRFTTPFIRKTAEEGRPGTMMPKFTPRLSRGQLDDIAAYVASLQAPHGAPAPPEVA